MHDACLEDEFNPWQPYIFLIFVLSWFDSRYLCPIDMPFPKVNKNDDSRKKQDFAVICKTREVKQFSDINFYILQGRFRSLLWILFRGWTKVKTGKLRSQYCVTPLVMPRDPKFSLLTSNKNNHFHGKEYIKKVEQ